MNAKPYLLALVFWVPYTAFTLYCLAPERAYLSQPGLYAEPDYRGLYFSTLVTARLPYARAAMACTLLGVLIGYPAMVHLLASAQKFTPSPEYSGNLIGEREVRYIRKQFKTLEQRTLWKIPKGPRNQVWVGIDILTGEDVFLDGEQIFTGMMIIGKQGSGKTSRWFKVILKQLARDPIDKTAVLVFTLKRQDATELSTFLQQLDLQVRPWSMCNLLDLATDASGGLPPATVEAILQAAAQATGLKSERDPFWLDTAINKLVETIGMLCRTDGFATLGRAYQYWADEIEGIEKAGREAKMEKGQFATVAPALDPMRNPSSRVSLLHSPAQDGGFHLGPLYAAPHSLIRRFTEQGIELIQTGASAQYLPFGAYELTPGARLPFDWRLLLAPTSLILPPPGGSKAERFALNVIKAALFSWISADMADPHHSALLCRDALQRRRIVLALDEAHNFVTTANASCSDTRALQEFREAGLVSLAATQSLSALKKGSQTDWETYLSVNGAYFFLPVSGKERQLVIDFIGKVGRRTVRKSFARSQTTGPRTTGYRDSYTESLQVEEAPYITPELYGQLPDGVAIHVTHGRPHRVVYCPYHTKVAL